MYLRFDSHLISIEGFVSMGYVDTYTSNSLSNRKRVMDVGNLVHAWFVSLGKCGALTIFCDYVFDEASVNYSYLVIQCLD